jgi:hypothetical protein
MASDFWIPWVTSWTAWWGCSGAYSDLLTLSRGGSTRYLFYVDRAIFAYYFSLLSICPVAFFLFVWCEDRYRRSSLYDSAPTLQSESSSCKETID